jgi:hypothetical protein
VFQKERIAETNHCTERTLKDSEYVGDMLRRWELISKDAQPKIVFKQKFFFPLEEESADPVVRDLSYFQAIGDVLAQRILMEETDVVKLASYQMQATWGDLNPSILKQLKNDLSEYLPKDVLENHSSDEWLKILSDAYANLKGTSADGAKSLYMSYVKKFPHYGTSIFGPVRVSVPFSVPFVSCSPCCFSKGSWRVCQH